MNIGDSMKGSGGVLKLVTSLLSHDTIIFSYKKFDHLSYWFAKRYWQPGALVLHSGDSYGRVVKESGNCSRCYINLVGGP